MIDQDIMRILLGFNWLERKINLFLKSIGFLQKNYSRFFMQEAKVIQQDKSEDLSVEIITIEIDEGNYITTIITISGDCYTKDERKTDSLEMAILEHNVAATRLIKKGLTKSDFKTPDVSVRPEICKKNSYLYGALGFTPMLPGTEE